MKKILPCIIVLLNLFNLQAQASKVKFGVQYNLDVWKPYTINVPKGLKSNIKSNTLSLNLEFAILSESNISWYTGLCYKYINYNAKDRLTSYFYQYQTGNAGVVTTHDVYYKYKDPADLKSISHSVGIVNEVDYQVLKKNKLSGKIGIQAEVYFYEKFKSEYVSSDTLFGTYNQPVSPHPLVSKAPRNFFLSGVNTALFFRMAFAEEEDVNFSAKISLGTNIYSDWDQFSRYGWVGIGLEMNYGNFKRKEKRE